MIVIIAIGVILGIFGIKVFKWSAKAFLWIMVISVAASVLQGVWSWFAQNGLSIVIVAAVLAAALGTMVWWEKRRNGGQIKIGIGGK
jgi:hypothetical protein